MGNLNYGEYDEDTAAQEKEELDASGGAEFMKLKVGRNIIRVLPPPVGQRKPYRTVHQHFIEIGPVSQSVICARLEAKKPCAVCQKVDELRKSQAKIDQDMASSLFARRRVFANVIDRAEPEKGPKVLAFGKTIHEQLVALRSDEISGADYVHPLKGYDVVIERTGTGKNDTKYKVTLARKESALGATEALMQEWIDTQRNLDTYAKLPGIEEVRKLLSGEDEDEEQEAAPPARGARSAAPSARARRTASDDTIDVEAEEA